MSSGSWFVLGTLNLLLQSEHIMIFNWIPISYGAEGCVNSILGTGIYVTTLKNL